MVNDRNSIQVSNSEDQFTKPIKSTSKGEYITPEWTIDDDGIPYCTKQSEYQDIIRSNLKKRFPFEFEKRVNCQHCDHYHKDDCYFPKSEIDKIEEDRLKLKIRCQLCGTKIDRPFSILMSFFYKEKYGINMPIICCTCYAGLENGTFLKNSKRRSIIFAISFLISIYFLFNFFVTAFAFNWASIILIIVPFFFWGYLSFRDLRNMVYLRRGRKYYKQIMGAEESPKTKDSNNRRDDMLDEDDKKRAPDGAFDSPGYQY